MGFENDELRNMRTMMKTRRRLIALLIVAGVNVGMSGLPLAGSSSDPLESGFMDPPASARPGILWMWQKGGSISAEAITADLEAMKHAGITDAVVYTEVLWGCRDQRPFALMSDEWGKTIKWAASEAHRLGIGLYFKNGESIATMRGRWVTPEMSMQTVVESNTCIQGPGKVKIALPQPPAAYQHYRDIAVYAIPVAGDYGKSLHQANPRIMSNEPGFEPEALVDCSLESSATVSFGKNSSQKHIDFVFQEPFTVRSFLMHAVPHGVRGNIELQSSNNGTDFHTVYRTPPPNSPLLSRTTGAFPAVSATHFRFLFSGSGRIDVAALDLSASARQQDWLYEAGYDFAHPHTDSEVSVAESDMISAEKMLRRNFLSAARTARWNGMHWPVPGCFCDWDIPQP